MGHKHDFLDLEAFCNFRNFVVVAVAVAAADVDDAAVAAVTVAVAVAVDVVAAGAVAVGVVAAAVAVAVEEACPVLDRRLQHLGPLVLKLEEIFFGRSLPYVDHEVAK